MEQFSYYAPTRVIFGKNAEAQVGAATKAAGGTTALIHYGSGSAVRSGLIGRVTASLEEAGITVYTKGGVQANPALSLIEETLVEFKDKGIDFIVAVGGGSVIDSAKALGAAFPNPDIPVWNYFSGKSKPVAPHLPIGAVLTISAAGSETSDSCVVTNYETREKRGFSSEAHRPRYAIMNPELTYTLPLYQTACGVADIMMHTMDRYFAAPADNELTDQLAEAILRTTVQFGIQSMEEPEHYQAHSEIMWAGSLSHNSITGLGRDRDFSVHQLGHELSGRFDIAHGASLTIMWPAWAKLVYKTNPARFARLGRQVFGVATQDDDQAALDTIAAVEAYFTALKLPICMSQSEIGVMSQEDLDVVTTGCSRGQSRSVGSFHPIDHEQMSQIYQMANH